MPPPKAGKKLTPTQLGKLRQWINEGAAWSGHWAFQPPTRPATPAVRRKGWVQNSIDAFVLARLEQDKLLPQVEADPCRLCQGPLESKEAKAPVNVQKVEAVSRH